MTEHVLQLATVPTGNLTLADVLALPASVDLRTAARAWGVGMTLAYELAQTGGLPFPVVRVGNTWRVPSYRLLESLGVPAALTAAG